MPKSYAKSTEYHFVIGTTKPSRIYSRHDNLTSLLQLKGITLLIGVQNLS